MLGKLQRSATKLSENQVTTCVVGSLAAMNIVGLLATRRLTAALFFAMVVALMYQFTKNIVWVLLVALMATNFLVYNRSLREGMTTEEDAEDDTEDDASTLAQPKDKVKKPVTNKKPQKQAKDGDAVTPNPTKKRGTATEKFSAASLSSAAPVSDAAPRVDYASTMESAYDNLDKMLGSDSIRKLSGDTQKLMANQQKLFDTMQTMAPALESAKAMLKGLDVGGLNDIVNGMNGK